jgi:hypothetical protein
MSAEQLYRQYQARICELVASGRRPVEAEEQARKEAGGYEKLKSVTAGSLLSSFERQPRLHDRQNPPTYGQTPYKMPSAGSVVSHANVTK